MVYNEGEVVHGAPCDLEVGIDASSITLATNVTSCPVGVEMPLRVRQNLFYYFANFFAKYFTHSVCLLVFYC